MADDTTRTDDKQIIAVAAAVAGRTPDGMTIEEARQILRGDGSNKLLDDAINTAARDSREFLSKSYQYIFKEHPEILKDMITAVQNDAVPLVSSPHIGTLSEALYCYLWNPAKEPGTEATELEEMRRQFITADYKSLFFTAGLVLTLNALAENLTQGELAGDPAKAAKYLTLLRDVAQANIKLFELADELQRLEPHIKAELDAAGDTTELIKIYDTGIDTRTGTIIPGSRLEKLVEAARAAAKRKQLPKVSYQNSTEVKTVTDKFSNLFFSLFAPQSKGMINGQQQFIPVRYEKEGAKKEITLFYDYSFNEEIIKRFGLSRSFDDQAFFVASIIDNLLNEGNNTVSLTKVWHELGNSGSPSAEALTNLVNILRLGMSTTITADISQLSDAWGIKKGGKTSELISQVIPVQIAQEKFAANGKTANAVINITGHTPFFIIGYQLGHFTTWNKDVLRLYKGRRTKRYYSVLRFLITQVGWMRNGKSKRSNKILYESLYKHTGDKSTRARQLSRDMMYRLFDEVFIPTGYISAYKEDSSGKPGVKLTYTAPPKITTKK